MKRYLIIFAALVGLMLSAAFVASCWFEPINGDLTRIGNYSERDFGWTAEQPVVAVHANGSAVVAPNVMVLGDSFSVGNVWQSALATETGLRTQSFAYLQNECIGAWVEKAAHDPTAQMVVIESVERIVIRRFKDVTSCSAPTITAWEGAPTETAPQRARWLLRNLHVWHTAVVAWNTLRALRQPWATITQNDVVNAPIRSGCGKFSHREQGRFLYLTEDDEKWGWTPDQVATAVASVARLQAMVEGQGKRFVFVLVPDKSTVYRPCLSLPEKVRNTTPPDVFAAMVAGGIHGPDVLSALRLASLTVIDVYDPNNTHLSTQGYQVLARSVQPLVVAKPGG